MRPAAAALAAVAGLAVCGCDAVYPEVVVVNATRAPLLLKDPSFNGCRWSAVLGLGEATTPHACLPGEDRVHFARLDVETEAENGDAAPTWFNYQTTRSERVEYGGFYVFEVSLDMEQDFSIPGPYGH